MGSFMSGLKSSANSKVAEPETTVIINRTSNPLEMKMGNHRFFTNLATVAKNDSYAVKANSNDTYQEYRLEAVHNSSGNSVIVNSDECVDNKTIIIKEVEGKLQVEREPRELPRLSSSSAIPATLEDESVKKSKWLVWW
ncbi:hypothetical protein M758_9G066800 [Ceratodon purpureus]|nr:hypothetical protein M758_9G066800 [Ceratodon purpureus]